MEQGQELYQSWLKFFSKDLEMKEAMYKMAPDTRYTGASHAERISDELYYGIRDLKTDLLSAAGPFLSEAEKAYVHQWAHEAQMKVAEAGLDIGKLQKAYRETISDMRPQFVRDVNSQVFGYSTEIDTACPISNAKTFNEILHRVHLYMERNSYLHEQFPQTHNVSQDVTVLGEPTALTRQLESSLAPLCDIDNIRHAGEIAIISINENSALAMFRDIGHSTTFKIDRTEDGQCTLSYYIPKVTNKDMVQQLPGFQSMQDGGGRTSSVATGSITIDDRYIGVAAMTLAYNIPSDMFDPQFHEVTDTSFHTAEQIITQDLPTDSFQDFMSVNMAYATSDIGIDAFMRGYERDYPGYIQSCIQQGNYVPEMTLQAFTQQNMDISQDVQGTEYYGYSQAD